MQNFLYYLKKYGRDVLIFTLLIIAISLMIYDSFIKKETVKKSESDTILTDLALKKEEKDEQTITSKFYVDVKGAVKKPGVYEVSNNTIINDVIKLAGGFNANAYQNGINMSKKLSNEMVIYVYTKSEIAKIQNDNNLVKEIEVSCKTPDYNICECVNEKKSIIEVGENTNKSDDLNSNMGENISKVNINTASISELTTLTGVGESKAQAIIKYREDNGKFNKIDDIMNVSGIGEKAFEKIKDFITI